MRYAVASIVLVLMAQAPAFAAPTYVSGRVVTEGTGGGPVAAAVVALRRADESDPAAVTQTLTNGSFILRAPAPGDYRLSVTAANCLPLDRDLKVPAGGIVSVQLVATRMPVLRFQLVGPDGAPVTRGYLEARVYIARGAYRVPMPPITGPAPANGMLEIPVPSPFQRELVQDLTITVRDDRVGCGQRSLDSWPDSPVMLALARGDTMRAMVRDRRGVPAPGATVFLFRVGDRGLRPGGNTRGVAGADGVCEIKALFPGRYVARISIPGDGAWSQLIILTEPATDLVLTPSAAARNYRR